jgi:outer membrane receptor for ferrienterochelin and colicins
MSAQVWAQHTLRVHVLDATTGEALIAATVAVEGTAIGTITDEEGRGVLRNIPEGRQSIVFSYIGYEPYTQVITFPLKADRVLEVRLVPSGQVLDVIVIESTRGNRSIENVPTRVEVLTEEIDEAGTMDPGKISHLLTHSTGIQVQQTGATLGNANVRIQGLDGRYTQILRDGFPLYDGFSGSLSILQIPPLDLRQVEFIKGSASTLYGGGAIAGLINLVSKNPTYDPELMFHLNGSTLGQADVNAFYSNRSDLVGFTLFVSRNTQAPYDPNGDGYSDLPGVVKHNINPRLFLYPREGTRIVLGATLTDEVRDGGDMDLLRGRQRDSLHFYREMNDTRRITGQLRIDHDLGPRTTATLKQSISYFSNRMELREAPVSVPAILQGGQRSLFTEASVLHNFEGHALVYGANLYHDAFEARYHPTGLEEGHLTAGLFAQHTLDLSWFSLESGLRTDYNVEFDRWFVLPRLSGLIKYGPKWSTRIGGGMGYRLPTIFNEEAERVAYRNVAPIDRETARPEYSYGGNADISFKTPFGNGSMLSLNQLFFFTWLDNPLIPVFEQGMLYYRTPGGHTDSRGFETQMKLQVGYFTLFVGYTYTDARLTIDEETIAMPLTPKHSLKGDLLFDYKDWRLGADYEYKGTQVLSDGRETRAFWGFGVLAQRNIGRWTVYVNFENLPDSRQGRFESLLTGPHGTPQFTEIWAPMDGFYANAGFRVRF